MGRRDKIIAECPLFDKGKGWSQAVVVGLNVGEITLKINMHGLALWGARILSISLNRYLSDNTR